MKAWLTRNYDKDINEWAIAIESEEQDPRGQRARLHMCYLKWFGRFALTDQRCRNATNLAIKSAYPVVDLNYFNINWDETIDWATDQNRSTRE
jgi:hypothetical protein